jgi:phosphonate transport system permease protein
VTVPRAPLRRLRSAGLWLVLALFLAWSWSPAEMSKATSLFTDWRNMAEFVTIQIAAWGTALAVVLGIPCAILSSSNVCPQWVVQPMRRLMDSFRAINEIVFALLFVVAVGLGPFAGVMALFVHNTGIIAKLFSEAVEAADPRPVEGIRATGASRLQEVIFGLIPQVMPLWTSFTLYRFETNVRSATVLGIIGAGGIGQTIYENIRSFHYSETAAIVIIIVISVMIIDLVSAQLRRVLV